VGKYNHVCFWVDASHNFYGLFLAADDMDGTDFINWLQVEVNES